MALSLEREERRGLYYNGDQPEALRIHVYTVYLADSGGIASEEVDVLCNSVAEALEIAQALIDQGEYIGVQVHSAVGPRIGFYM